MMDEKLREKLLVLYGYLTGLNGKPIGTSFMGGVEKFYVPQDMVEPLRELLFGKEQ